QVPQDMTVDIPEPRIIGVELHSHTRLTRNQYCVAQRSCEALIIDRHDFKCVSVQMHWMRHRRLVDKLDRRPLAILHVYLSFLLAGIFRVEGNAINRPYVLTHVALQVQDTGYIHWTLAKRGYSCEFSLQIQVEQPCLCRTLLRHLRNRGAVSRQDDPGLFRS